MSKSFGEYFQELRLELNLTQDELAKELSLHPVVIQNWETGASRPTRVKIRRAGKTLHLDFATINNMLVLANYPPLSSYEIATHEMTGSIILGRDEDIDQYFQQSLKFIKSTGTSMGGTIDNLGGRIDAIENSIGEIQATFQHTFPSVVSSIPTKIEEIIKPLRQEVSEIKVNIIPQLEQTQEQITGYESFVRENAEFLKSAVEAQGILKILQGQMDAFEKRLAHVENQLNIRRTRTIVIISTIVAIVSLGILIYQNFFN